MTLPMIGVTMGDPVGVGPEVCLLSLQPHLVADVCRPILIGDLQRLRRAERVLRESGRLMCPQFEFHAIDRVTEAVFGPSSTINIIDLNNVPEDLRWGEVSRAAGAASFAYLQRAVDLANGGAVQAICTAPINKAAWKLAEVTYPGHTEAIAAMTDTTRFGMMLVHDSLRVVHVSTHVSLRQAIELVTAERVINTTLLTAEAVNKLGIEKPRIAIAGMNPHAGEGGLFGDEEILHISPAVQCLRSEHQLDVHGPISPDTVYGRAATGEFDAVIAMYHDQGHIAVKMLGMDSGVNVTIGLPFYRTSVDHGTAFDIAGKGIAREESMQTALNVAALLSKRA